MTTTTPLAPSLPAEAVSAGWRRWPTRTGSPARFAKRVGSVWADVLETAAGYDWRVTIGVTVAASGSTAGGDAFDRALRDAANFLWWHAPNRRAA